MKCERCKRAEARSAYGCLCEDCWVDCQVGMGGIMASSRPPVVSEPVEERVVEGD